MVSATEVCLLSGRPSRVARRLSSAPGTNSGVLNGYLYVATVMLQSVLDGLAAACDKVAPVGGQGNIYFHSYRFVKSDVVWVSENQRAVEQIVWRGEVFKDVANAIKHEQAWVGCVGAPTPLGVRDIYDDQGRGFVYSMLVPVYKHAKAVVCRLANQLGQATPILPDL